MFTIEKDHRKRPIYEQLYRYYRNKIESGELSPGEKLPSRRELSSRLKLSPGTVENAYAQLVAEGYLVTREKSGCYVNDLIAPSQESGEVATALPEVVSAQGGRGLRSQIASYRYSLSTDRTGSENFPFSTWAKLMRECLSEENRGLLALPDPKGDRELRDEIAKYLSNYRGIEANPEQLVVGAGSEFLLGLLVQLMGRELVYALENPGYRKTERILAANGARTVFVPLDAEGVQIAELDRQGASVVHVTPSHHFPLGGVMPVGRRKELLRWASKGERYIIEDDYDSEFRFSGRPIPALCSLGFEGAAGGRVVYTNTFTKSLMPSLRISYILLPVALMDRYERLFSFYSCSVPNFEQRTLWRFLARGYFGRHLNRMKTVYRARRDAFLTKLTAESPDGQVEVSGRDAGLHLVVGVRNGMCERELVDSAGEAGVEVSGLSEYYHATADDMPKSSVVVGYSEYPAEDLHQAAELLCRAWFGRGTNEATVRKDNRWTEI